MRVALYNGPMRGERCAEEFLGFDERGKSGDETFFSCNQYKVTEGVGMGIVYAESSFSIW